MTEQLKAEEFVRSQRPVLMELTFGCEVIKSDMWQGTVVGEAYEQVAYLNTEKMQVFLAPAEQFTIIGHPIQLNDWLAILAWGVKQKVWKEPNIHFSGANSLRIGAGTPDSIIFNLTTGQPATEADYLAFNDIVGV